jgi:hypothetical protein
MFQSPVFWPAALNSWAVCEGIQQNETSYGELMLDVLVKAKKCMLATIYKVCSRCPETRNIFILHPSSVLPTQQKEVAELQKCREHVTRRVKKVDHEVSNHLAAVAMNCIAVTDSVSVKLPARHAVRPGPDSQTESEVERQAGGSFWCFGLAIPSQ